jgi:MFS family permease
VTSEFSDNKEKYIGWLEGAIGFGVITGPIMGSFVFDAYGYQWVFYFNSLLMLYNMVSLLMYLPINLN